MLSSQEKKFLKTIINVLLDKIRYFRITELYKLSSIAKCDEKSTSSLVNLSRASARET